MTIKLKLLPDRYANSWEIYAVLLFLGLYLYPLRAASAAVVALDLACLAAFLPLYFLTHWPGVRRAPAALIGILALGAATLPANPGASVFFSYAACLGCLVLPTSRALIWTACVVLSFAGLAALFGDSNGYILGNSFIILVVAAIYLQVRRGEMIKERLARRDEEIEAIARVAERERIAGDLHDLFGQTFALISVKAELAKRLFAAQPADGARELTDLTVVARGALAKARETVDGYRQAGLDEELRAATGLLEAAGITVHIRREPYAPSALADSLLALVLRECVTNVVRHAGARRCMITLTARGEGAVFEVRDDGVGARAYEGAGVRGMAERARRMGGDLTILRDGGTVVRVRAP